MNRDQPRVTSYSIHIPNFSVYTHKHLQIIKALPATVWDKLKKTLMAAYKAVMRRRWGVPHPYGFLFHPRLASTNGNQYRTQH